MILAAGIYSPVMGIILDKFPIRKILTIGAFFFGLGFILLSTAQSFIQFLIIYGTFVALGVVIFGNLSTAKLISNWFNEKIGTALGYASIGLSASGVIIPPIAGEIIKSIFLKFLFILVLNDLHILYASFGKLNNFAHWT